MNRFPTPGIKLLCQLMSRAASAMAILLLVLGIGLWTLPQTTDFIARELSTLKGIPITIDWTVRFFGAALSGVYVGLISYALWIASWLFAGFAEGQIFEPKTGKRLRQIGFIMTVFALASPVVRTLLALLLTFENPPGQHVLIVSLSSDEFVIAIFGALILVLGHVMAEAARIAEDYQQIV